MPHQYHAEQNENYKKKIDELLAELPSCVTAYDIAIGRTVSLHSMYLYLQRLHVFFCFLEDSNPYYKKIGMKQLTYSHLNKLTVDDIDEFIHSIYSKNLDPQHPYKAAHTVNNYLSALNSFFKYLYLRDKIKENVVAKASRSRLPKKTEVIRMTPDQEQRFMSSVSNGQGLSKRQLDYKDKHDFMSLRDIALTTLLLRTGLRVSELVSLDTTSFFWELHAFQIIRKREKPETIYMDDETQELIQNYLNARNHVPYGKDSEALFIVTQGKYKGQRLTVRSVETIVKKYAKASVPELSDALHVHSLRATCAGDLLDATDGDLSYVQNVLGHESVTTTQKYYIGEDTRERYRKRNLLIEKKPTSASTS